MNNKMLWIVIAIVVVIILGGGAYWFMSKQPQPSVSNSTEASDDAPQSLKDLMATNRPMKCEFSNNNDVGIVYVANGKVRGDFTTSANGQTMQAHMITDSETSYTWIEGMKTGYKISISAAGQEATTNTNVAQEQFNTDQKLDYRCDGWSADASIFILPSDVEFNDLSAMMPTTGSVNVNTNAQGSAGAGAPNCSICDSIPSESRSECLTALGCN